jgi:hypothetical protein
MSPPAADGNLAELVRPAQHVVQASALELLDDETGFSLPRAIVIAALLSLPFWALFAFALYLMR